MVASVDDVRFEGSQFEVIANTGLPDVSDGDADWGDFDGDGDMDLLFSGVGAPGIVLPGLPQRRRNLLALLQPQCRASMSVKWLDTDHDGDLDAVCAFPQARQWAPTRAPDSTGVSLQPSSRRAPVFRSATWTGTATRTCSKLRQQAPLLLRNNGDGCSPTFRSRCPPRSTRRSCGSRRWRTFPSLAVEGEANGRVPGPERVPVLEPAAGHGVSGRPFRTPAGSPEHTNGWGALATRTSSSSSQAQSMGTTRRRTLGYGRGTAVPNTLRLLTVLP